MAYTQNLLIRINSVLDGKAFQNAKQRIKGLQDQYRKISKVMNAAKGIQSMTSRMEQWESTLNKAGYSLQDLRENIQRGENGALEYVKSNKSLQKVEQDIASTMDQQKRAWKSRIQMGADWADQINNARNKAQSAWRSIGENTEGAISPMERVRREGKAIASRFGQIQGTTGEVGDATEEAQKSGRRFRFEFLSIMFLGMRLKKTFSGLLKPALKAAGVFDVWGTTMKLLFLPTAMDVLDVVLGILDWVSGLDQDTKKMIGRFAILGTVLGTILSVGGMLTITFQSLAGAQWVAVNSAGMLATIFGAFLGTLIAVPIILEKIKKWFGKTTQVAIATASAIGLIGLAIAAAMGAIALGPVAIAAAIGAGLALLVGYFDEVKYGFGQLLKWFGSAMDSFMSAVIMPITGPIDMIIKAVNALTGKNIDTISGKIGDAATGLGEKLMESADIDKTGGGGGLSEKVTGLFGKASSPAENLTPRNMAGNENNTVINDLSTNVTAKGESDKMTQKEIEKAMDRVQKKKSRKTNVTKR